MVKKTYVSILLEEFYINNQKKIRRLTKEGWRQGGQKAETRRRHFT
jgi:hypothetical protein